MSREKLKFFLFSLDVSGHIAVNNYNYKIFNIIDLDDLSSIIF